jgi:hypothetical protein
VDGVVSGFWKESLISFGEQVQKMPGQHEEEETQHNLFVGDEMG